MHWNSSPSRSNFLFITYSCCCCSTYRRAQNHNLISNKNSTVRFRQIEDKKQIVEETRTCVRAPVVSNAHLSVAKASLSLDVRDDFQSTEIELQILQNVCSDSLCWTPRAAAYLQTNPVVQVTRFRFFKPIRNIKYIKHAGELSSKLSLTEKYCSKQNLTTDSLTLEYKKKKCMCSFLYN